MGLPAHAVKKARGNYQFVGFAKRLSKQRCRRWGLKVPSSFPLLASRPMKSRDVPASVVKESTNDYFTVRLQRQSIYLGVGAGIEGGIEGAIAVQAADEVAGLTIESGEASPDKNLVVVLHCNSSNRIICRSIKIGIERAVTVQTGDKAATSARNGGERSSTRIFPSRTCSQIVKTMPLGPGLGDCKVPSVIKNAIRLRAVPLMV